jgi:hypothetical protein
MGWSVFFCRICHGTRLSGELYSCLHCDDYKVHFHCFKPDDPKNIKYLFICERCCRVSSILKQF